MVEQMDKEGDGIVRTLEACEIESSAPIEYNARMNKEWVCSLIILLEE